MWHTIKKHWRIFWHFRKIHLIESLNRRGSFFFWSMISTIWTIFNISFFTMITGVTGQIGSWNSKEMAVLLAVFTILDGLNWSWFYANMFTYTASVYDGRLSMMLLKPVNPHFLVLTQDNSYNDIFRIGIGIVFLAISLQQLGTPVSLFQILLFIPLFICGILLDYSLWFFVSTWTFWVERLNNINDIFPNLRRIMQAPREIYTGIFSTVFTVFLPLGLIVSIPAEVLTGKYSYTWVIYFITLTLFVFFFSRWFFYFSLKKYSSVGN